MAPSAEPPQLDVARLIAALDRHGVEYLLVGGIAAQAHGASRQTVDFGCVARRTGENLDRLADVMRELNARLRAEGLSDEDAASLPVRLDRSSLLRMEISTWRTDAGDLDIWPTSRTDPVDASATTNLSSHRIIWGTAASWSEWRRSWTSLPRRSGRTVRRITKRFPSCEGCETQPAGSKADRSLLRALRRSEWNDVGLDHCRRCPGWPASSSRSVGSMIRSVPMPQGREAKSGSQANPGHAGAGVRTTRSSSDSPARGPNEGREVPSSVSRCCS